VHLNPRFLGASIQEIHGEGYQPMRQPSIEGAGERPPLAVFDPFQVFEGNRFDARQVKLFEGRAQPRLDFGSGVLLAFGKVLDTLMQFLSNGLAIGEDQAAFVVGIHTQHATGFPLKGPGLCEDQIQPQALPLTPQPHGFGHFPTACKPPVDKPGGLEGQDQTRRAGADQLYAPVEAGPCESFKGRELQVHGQCGELPLRCLTRPEVTHYLAARLALEAPQAAPLQELGRLIHQRTDGNPLFMVTLVDALVAQGMIGKGALAWPGQDAGWDLPENLREVLEMHLERLTPEEQQVLEAASVAGRSLRRGRLRRA
jgi:Predicted ATPase